VRRGDAHDVTAAAGVRVADFGYHGGPVINTPKLYSLFVGDWTSATRKARAARLNRFLADFLASRYMNILAQYGCGSSGTLAGTAFIASGDKDLTGTDLRKIVRGAVDSGVVPEPSDPAVCVVLYLDDFTGVRDPEDGGGNGPIVLCEATNDNAFGFHEFLTTTAGHRLAFSVIPGLTDTCLKKSCPSDANCSLHLDQSQEQRQTQVTSHELSEMFTDPFLDAWLSPTSGENGDICNGQSGTITVGDETWTVQRMYSKRDDVASGGTTTCITEAPEPLPSLLDE
jgi:hypothetical protein